MCICSGPAHLAATRIYAGEFFRDGQALHTLIYQNEAESRAPGPNCMLLHLPSADTMTRANAIETDAAGAFLEDVIDAIQPLPLSVVRGPPCAAPPQGVEVFEYGIYTVVLSRSPALIMEALTEVPEHKRPEIQPALLDFYAEQFPGWSLALCCFDNQDRQRAQPLVWWYRPMFPHTLFAPGVDSHTGDPPDLGAEVVCDHEVVFGTTRAGERAQPGLEGLRGRYTGPLAELLPQSGAYTMYATANSGVRYPNADFALELETLLKEPWATIERRVFR